MSELPRILVRKFVCNGQTRSLEATSASHACTRNIKWNVNVLSNIFSNFLPFVVPNVAEAYTGHDTDTYIIFENIYQARVWILTSVTNQNETCFARMLNTWKWNLIIQF